MSGIVGKVGNRLFLGRRVLAAAAGALLLVGFAAPAPAAPTEEELQNGRLGYKWVPEPPKRPLTPQEELGVEIAKYGGGGLIVVWLLRRMFSAE